MDLASHGRRAWEARQAKRRRMSSCEDGRVLPMSDTMPFWAVAALATIGIFWLAGYLYGLYWVGRRLGRRFRSVRRPWVPYSVLAFLSACLASTAAFLPADRFTRFFAGLVLFAAHAHPLLVGFWNSAEQARREDRRVWKDRAEAWISDWERTPKE